MPPKSSRPVTPSPASGAPLFPPKRKSPFRSTIFEDRLSIAALAFRTSSSENTPRTTRKPFRSNKYFSRSVIVCATSVVSAVSEAETVSIAGDVTDLN